MISFFDDVYVDGRLDAEVLGLTNNNFRASFFVNPGTPLTQDRTFYVVDEDGTLATREWVNSQFIPLSQKAAPGGVATLDANGVLLLSQMPSSVMEYKGTWNASTNTPSLVNGTGNLGDTYRVSVAGTHDFGSGPIEFFVGNYVIYNGSVWERSGAGDTTLQAVTEQGNRTTLNVEALGHYVYNGSTFIGALQQYTAGGLQVGAAAGLGVYLTAGSGNNYLRILPTSGQFNIATIPLGSLSNALLMFDGTATSTQPNIKQVPSTFFIQNQVTSVQTGATAWIGNRMGIGDATPHSAMKLSLGETTGTAYTPTGSGEYPSGTKALFRATANGVANLMAFEHKNGSSGALQRGYFGAVPLTNGTSFKFVYGTSTGADWSEIISFGSDGSAIFGVGTIDAGATEVNDRLSVGGNVLLNGDLRMKGGSIRLWDAQVSPVGTEPSMGKASFPLGTTQVTINSSKVTANSRIFCQAANALTSGGVSTLLPGGINVDQIVSGSFRITVGKGSGPSAIESVDVFWIIINPNS